MAYIFLSGEDKLRMRILQIGLLVLAVVVLLLAARDPSTLISLILWRTGIAVLLVDVVICLIWPTGGKRWNDGRIGTLGK